MQSLKLVLRAALVSVSSYGIIIWIFGLSNAPITWLPAKDSLGEWKLNLLLTGYWDIPAWTVMFTASMWIFSNQEKVENLLSNEMLKEFDGLYGQTYFFAVVAALFVVVCSTLNGYLFMTGVLGILLAATAVNIVVTVAVSVLLPVLSPIFRWIIR